MSTEAGGDSTSARGVSAKTSTKKSVRSNKPAATPAQHPTYKDMVNAAITALKDRKGTSRQSVAKYIKTNYKVKDNCDIHVNGALVKGVTSGTLIQTSGKGASGRFKLAKVATKPAQKKVHKIAAKRPAVKTASKKAAKPKKAAVGKAKKKTVAKKSVKKVVKKLAAKAKGAGKKASAKAPRGRARPPAKKSTKKPARKASGKKK